MIIFTKNKEQRTKNNKTQNLLSVICYLLSEYCGFTIIEILVALSVIFFFIGLGFAGYASFNQRQILLSAGQTLKSIIRDTQSRAYNNEVDCTPGICDCTINSAQNLTGWYVDFTSKSIYGKCGSNPNFSQKPFNLSSDISLTVFMTPAPTPPLRLLYKNSPPSVSQPADICLASLNLSNSFYKISINMAGVVSDSQDIVPVCP